MQSVLIFGRQAELGLAETESLYGADNVKPLTSGSALVNVDPCNLTLKRLGGAVKLGKLLTQLPYTEWSKIEKFLCETAPNHSRSMPAGKMQLGISAYNFNISPKDITKSAVRLKKSIIATGRSVRVIPNRTSSLNAASVIHNKLVTDNGWELLIIKVGTNTYIGQTVLVQDIDSYAARDQARPKRDARVGMLPPKLAQIIINLASPKLTLNKESDGECKPSPLTYDKTVLDPFCGSGVILQEALLMGYNAVGCDIDARLVDYSQENIRWLKSRFDISQKARVTIKKANAERDSWPKFDFVASEANLGKPLNHADLNEIKQISFDVNASIVAFLKNLHTQTKPGIKHCIAVPAWQIDKNKFLHLPLIDHLSDLGYNLIEFKHLNSAKPLIYYRPDQVVARELLVISRR